MSWASHFEPSVHFMSLVSRIYLRRQWAHLSQWHALKSDLRYNGGGLRCNHCYLSDSIRNLFPQAVFIYRLQCFRDIWRLVHWFSKGRPKRQAPTIPWNGRFTPLQLLASHKFPSQLGDVTGAFLEAAAIGVNGGKVVHGYANQLPIRRLWPRPIVFRHF